MSESISQPLKFLPPSIETHHEDPFRDDVFDRKPLAENLTKLISSFARQPFVLGINGTWGSGKTKFLEMWAAQLRSAGYRTLHFNAWENDHADDPFAAVLSEFRLLTETESPLDKSKVKRVWDKVAKKSLPILERAAAGIVRNLTLGVLDLKSDDMENIISELAEESAKHALKKCEESRKSIEAFRAELATFVQMVDDPHKPVVYMVDELDRCRPTFAIAVLERIKHLLNVPGVVFIFAWDRQQLNCTIRSIYGEQTDPGGYLMRLIDLELNLPQGDAQHFCKALMIRSGLKDYLYDNNSPNATKYIVDVFPRIAEKFKLTIREQEKAFVALSISCRIGVLDICLYIDLLILLIVVRIKNPDLYHLICKIEDNYNLVVDKELPQIMGDKYWTKQFGGQLKGAFLYALPDNMRETLYTQFEQGRSKSGSRDAEICKGYEIAQDCGCGRGGPLKAIIQKMEFTASFWS